MFWSYCASNFTPKVKQARNQSQICSRKSISHNTTRHQSLHLQTMLTGETLKGKSKARESNQPQGCSETAQLQLRQLKLDIASNSTESIYCNFKTYCKKLHELNKT